VVMLLQATPAAAQMRGPDSWKDCRFTPSTTVERKQSINPGGFIVRGLFYGYQRGAGPTKGARCPSYPSCSEYSRRAFQRKPAPEALMLTIDRLNRCGHDEQFYEYKFVGDGPKVIDPVP